MAVELKWCIFDPILVKPKCVWEAVVYLKNCKQTSEKCELIFENWKKTKLLDTTSQTHFGLTNIGSNMHRFSSTAIYFWQFSIGTPCSPGFKEVWEEAWWHVQCNVKWKKLLIQFGVKCQKNEVLSLYFLLFFSYYFVDEESNLHAE